MTRTISSRSVPTQVEVWWTRAFSSSSAMVIGRENVGAIAGTAQVCSGRTEHLTKAGAPNSARRVGAPCFASPGRSRSRRTAVGLGRASAWDARLSRAASRGCFCISPRAAWGRGLAGASVPSASLGVKPCRPGRRAARCIGDRFLPSIFTVIRLFSTMISCVHHLSSWAGEVATLIRS